MRLGRLSHNGLVHVQRLLMRRDLSALLLLLLILDDFIHDALLALCIALRGLPRQRLQLQ